MASSKLTPELVKPTVGDSANCFREFISLPQRSDLIPNPDRTHALYTETTYSRETDQSSTSLYILSLSNLKPKLLWPGSVINDPKWIGYGTQLAWTKTTEACLEIWIGGAIDEFQYKAAEIPRSLSLLHAQSLANDAIGFLFYGAVRSQSAIHFCMKEFLSLPVQDLGGFIEKPDPSLWYAKLQRQSGCESRFTLSPQPGILDILQGTDLKFDPYPFALPFGLMSYAMSSNTIAYPAVPVDSPDPEDISSNLYCVSISSLDSYITTPRALITACHSGQCLLPAFSPSGNLLAFTRGESKANSASDRKLYVTGITDDRAREVVLERNGTGVYIEIESILWSYDEKSLFICSTCYGTRCLVKVNIHGDRGIVQPLYKDSSVSSVYRFSNDQLLLSSSSFVCPSEYAIYDLSLGRKISLKRVDLTKFGISERQVSEFSCKGDANDDVQTWVVTPSFFDPTQKYPLAMFIHGGPIWPETNSWLARWNMLLIAEQGYVVVSPNFGGSPGVSSRFKQKVLGHFGDIPQRDLEACMGHIAHNMEFVDVDRATALGGSFGGFMTFWIAGQPFGRKFKAMVSHAGIFNAPSLAGTDVPDAWRLLFGGTDRERDLIEVLQQWDPAQHSHNWETPMLISVGEKDRRIAPLNGIGAFSALQFRGVESRLLVFPDEGHIISKPANLLKWYETVISWINQHTGVNQAGRSATEKQ